ncbi:MAG: hypothetical protein ACK53V_10990, partial [Planctomycetota bacterium]
MTVKEFLDQQSRVIFVRGVASFGLFGRIRIGCGIASRSDADALNGFRFFIQPTNSHLPKLDVLLNDADQVRQGVLGWVKMDGQWIIVAVAK